MSKTTFMLLQSSQLLLPFICLALGASMLGISSDILAFTHHHKHDRVNVRDNTGFYPYLIHLPYLPRNFSLTRPILLLVTGMLCALLNAAALVLLVRSRKAKVDGKSKAAYNFRPSLSVIICDSIALLLTLAMTIYAWNSLHLFPGDDSKPFNGPLKSHNGLDVHWDQDTAFDPINWNCIIYPFAHRAFGRNIKTVCREGLALVDLTVPLLVMECAALCVHFWFWRPNKNGDIADADAAKTEGESYRMDDFSRSDVNATG